MTVSKLKPLVLAALAFAVVGCDQGRTNPADVKVRVMNVAPGFALLQFRREKTEADDIGFKTGIQSVYDEDTYDFSVDVRNANGGTDEKWTFSKNVQAGTLYTFLLEQSGTGVRERILEAPIPAATATQAQVILAHSAERLPDTSIFLERPGTDIAGAIPFVTLGYRGATGALDVPTGDYEITLTEAGNRANVLFTSSTFTLEGATSTSFVITPEGDESLSPVSVTAVSGTAAGEAAFGSFLDRNARSAVRVLNAAADAAPRDVAFNGQFSPPLFTAVPFAAPTAYVQIAPAADIPVQVTPPGNPGVLELDQKITAVGTQKHTLMFTGAAGALTHAFVANDERRIIGESSVRFYDAAGQFTGLDLLVLPAGFDPATSAAIAILPPGTVGTPVSVPPASYDVYLRQTATTTIVAGPVPVTLAAEGIYGVLATDGPDSVSAAITLIDDFQ